MKKFTGFEKGVNLGGWISQCKEYTKEHYDSFICKKDLERIKNMGFDHVRLTVDYNVIMSEAGDFLEEGFFYIDSCIQWAEEFGLKVIVDLHKTCGYMFDTNVIPNPDDFFYDKKLQDSFVRIWETLAGRYGLKYENVAFELLNEIVNPNLENEWNQIASRAFLAIRAIAPKSWIVVGGVCYNSVSAVPGIKVPVDEKTVFTFHCYEPLVFTHQKAYWIKNMPLEGDVYYPGDTIEYIREKSAVIDQARHGAIFDPSMNNLQINEDFFTMLFGPALKAAERIGVPLYCGEYGVIDQAPVEDSKRWFNDIHAALKKLGIGRALWSYKLMDFGITDSHYDSIREEVLKFANL